MAGTQRGRPTDAANRIIESVRDSAEPALEAVRRFVDTVDRHFPDVGEDGPRRHIIDAAFKMAEQLVKTGTQAAEKIVSATGETLGQGKGTTASKKVASTKKPGPTKPGVPKADSRKRTTPRPS
jgi:hypothetical protein